MKENKNAQHTADNGNGDLANVRKPLPPEHESTVAIRFKDWCDRNEHEIRLRHKRPITTGELYWMWEKQAK